MSDVDDLARTTGRTVVIVVAATRCEQERLLGLLPDDVCVVLAGTRERARELLDSGAADSVCAAVGPGVDLDPEARVLRWRGRSLRLTPLEFETLTLLSSDQKHVWSIPELTRDVWATGFVGDGAQVRSVIKRLRRKLAEAGMPVDIRTIRGVGFQATDRPDVATVLTRIAP
ncbi:winged helix-turn-helix domain-containing protein [Serinicoccus kebangsaanensis]|uniref:winged helix-turn-helix domain-containing protein n=1 Tax=Serinicoccus kebangsaanensis TaxID=2602069 RepID=UPI00124EBF73|nr:winged helix-turn-helix domain-containing protein [Serinicoccus kebangsaanensis]